MIFGEKREKVKIHIGGAVLLADIKKQTKLEVFISISQFRFLLQFRNAIIFH